MKKFIFLLTGILLVAAAVVIATHIKKQNKLPAEKSNIQIVASFYPLAEFARQVGGDNVDVIDIVPAGLEPHDFEPTPQDLAAAVYSSGLFIFNGSGFDPWAEKIQLELAEKNIAVINMSAHIALIPGEEYEEEGRPRLDPHIWLDPVLVQKEVSIIRDTLKNIDPKNAASYDENAEKYNARLSSLGQMYQDGLASCAIRDVIASHAAFGYLARRYNIRVLSIAGLSPEEEPSPKKIAEIANFAREKNITHIFFETLVSPKLAETIAKEIGAQILVFNPIEGLTEAERASGKNYISLMEENLKNLRTALLCQ
ncbi:MAG TPA: ABC transporter substrate-binding protein [Candidatus Magasanikbacteria bacterium]|nr:MAG: hypothetical protein A3I74_03585 [Candidatus Magasanikbacteria bacterium RIFCSPLOWO2_02_FULL_47_16]OGH80164.1 MAG: hypothetical protein A3C10_03170 [Candidatus Magasanikbacteria bacterium RIFCSPHIGHO2_02_FULL_48_18]HAZ28358.1 ABC transporter substrate-binding protein [Candidatus Magasanikbacteria bacterium]